MPVPCDAGTIAQFSSSSIETIEIQFMFDESLRFSARLTVLPIIHGSGDFALEVRRLLLDNHFDAVAVPLPPSFRPAVLSGIEALPVPSMAVQRKAPSLYREWTPESEECELGSDEPFATYVPIDPCQGVITALRLAVGEHKAIEFIDMESDEFETPFAIFPDPYALKHVSIERFAAAILPQIQRPEPGLETQRIQWMAKRLRDLEQQYESTVAVVSIVDWPWLREAYADRPEIDFDQVETLDAESYGVDPDSLMFVMGELPFITGLYERARADLEEDENLTIDGVKEMLLAARESYELELGNRARRITPHHLRCCLKYIRNLSLIESRLSPDLYTIVVAAKQVIGDQFALHVAETAKLYSFFDDQCDDVMQVGINQGRMPDGDIVDLMNRLPGTALEWRSCELNPRPRQQDRQRWETQWNPFSQCSYAPEDDLIERFRAHVFDRAKSIAGLELAKTEKFTTSFKDGIDIRDTLRHWYDGSIYVKEIPPARGTMDCAVMLFDAPADPREYPWRTTWYAEHEEESTLAFFATDFQTNLVGPGIGLAIYGGALFLFPPIPIPDIWQDRRLDFTETLEERLLAAACIHSRSRQIVLLSALPPGAGYRKLAKRFKKHLIHLPLGHFSDATVQQLRHVHVLNGQEVRSYASHFIRRV
jgi:hypothetical protein